jgi:magnesium transporter
LDFDKIKLRLDELLNAGRHGELRGALRMLNVVDIAEYMQTLDRERSLVVFRILPKDIASDVFSYMDSDQREALIEMIGDSELSALVDEMFIDDAVDFLEELPANVVKRILQYTDRTRRDTINQFLHYPENSAGSIMTIEYCEFHTGVTVQKAMEEIKRTGLDKETIYTIYVIDQARHLVGTVALRKLIIADDETPIEKLMETNVISVHTLDDRESVAEAVRKYDLMSIPVVDKEDRLVGIITVDDVVDVIEEKNTEDFEKMAALLPSDVEYLRTSVFDLAKNRILWLMILLFSSTISSFIITHYGETLPVSETFWLALTASFPVLMNTSGNCGSQSSTLIIRGLALGEIEFHDILRALWKEVRVAVLVGAALALANYLRMVLINRTDRNVSLLISISMVVTVMLSSTLGCLLPMLAKKLKIDPALVASPVLTTLVDSVSLLVLFSLVALQLAVLR